jgi:HD-GYP domain-containing protein (c-di-GMP phosphodiesterase class II)
MLKFYKIKDVFFEQDAQYSFNIYMFHKESSQRIVSLQAKSPVTPEYLEKWKDLVEKGAYFQLYFEDLHTFYHETGITEAELMQENEFYFRMNQLQEDRIAKYKVKSEEKFLLKAALVRASESDDFLPIINKVKAEILCFPLYESSFMSTAIEVVDKVFVRDIIPVRTAVLSDFIAKQSNISEQEKLCEIVIASLLKDVGLCLFKSGSVLDFQNLRGEESYLKHPMISIFILSKVGFEFPKGVKRLVLEHHEQINGSGFPRKKKEDYIDYSSFIINMVDQILMYSAGKINGRKLDLIKTIELFHKGVSSDGINVNFPKRLLDSLDSFLLNELELKGE